MVDNSRTYRLNSKTKQVAEDDMNIDKIYIALYLMAQLIKRIAAVVTIIFMVWFTISYGEILTKNVRPNPQYSKWNFFTMTIDE